MMTQGAPLIRTAIVGYGLSGSVFHAPFVRADDEYEVTAIVTASPARQERARDDHPDARIYSTYRELLESGPSIDLVILATPPDTHVAFAEQAFGVGAGVVVDKPMAPTREDAASMVAASRAAGRPLMVFHNRRWDGDFLTIRGLIERGELGDVFAFESNFEHWAPESSSGWKDQLPTSAGGGVAYDLGSHLVDQALVLFGPISSQRSSLRTVRSGGGNDDHARIDLLHESGVESRLLMSRVSHGVGPRFRVLGTKGSFVSQELDGQETALAAGVRPDSDEYGVTQAADEGTLTVEGSAGVEQRRVLMERGGYPEFYRRAARAIRGLGGDPIPLAEAVAVVDVLESAVAEFVA